MALSNSSDRFGGLTRSFHWLTALLILTNIPLGVIANRLPYDTAGALAQKAQLFSLHKTLGVAVFLVAALRILWALSQPRPVPLHPERWLETTLAGAVHWLLYISLVAVPLTGWVHHAALAGYAPILWPFGQGLPFVPVDSAVAMLAGSLHWVFTKLLIAAIVLHVAGALKHHLIDKDATLVRMWRGVAASAVPMRARHGMAPALVAGVVYLVAAGLAWSLVDRKVTAPPAPVATSAGNWAVQAGTISFTVGQMGSDVAGSFANWQADIQFDEASGTGRVKVAIDTTSLTLGSVTKQAKEPEFFDVATHPTATFDATIAAGAEPGLYVANGTLALRGMTLPLALPFRMTITAGRAAMSGETQIDRRAYQIGPSYPDEASVGFIVRVAVAVTATQR